MNICCRHHKGCDENGNAFSQHPSGKVHENINALTKSILVGPYELSWGEYILYFTCSHMCV